MTGQRILPGLGLSAFWTPGSAGYEGQHDPDTRTLSILCQGAVISRTTNLPGSPADGEIYIVPTGQANADEVAARDNGAWVYLPPQEGWLVHVNDEDEYYKWTGTVWQVLATGGGGAPVSLEIVVQTIAGAYNPVLADSGKYTRMTSGTAVDLTVPPNSAQAFPIGTVLTAVQAGAGQITVVPGAGVTINATELLKTRKLLSVVTLIKVGTDAWDLFGDLEVAP